MDYAGYRIRRERIQRNWSQEGLCKGICTVSYLSKIEQGKTEASPQILRQLMERMDLKWAEQAPDLEEGYELLFSLNIPELKTFLADREACRAFSLDWMLLSRCCAQMGQPLEEDVEPFMDSRQLALQRILQRRDQEAVRLWPNGYLYLTAGSRCFYRGENTAALELLEKAYQAASAEGYPAIMLNSKLNMGSCYSNQQNLPAMEVHYRVAARLAKALGDADALETIRYNTAATQLEVGQYAQALSYFESSQSLDPLFGHKLAICYEKLGRSQDAFDALARTEDTEKQTPLIWQMRSLVRMRLEDPEYLDSDDYGGALLHCFQSCREQMPAGYAIFHLPWVLEWYEHRRQYKQAYILLRDFPEWSAMQAV